MSVVGPDFEKLKRFNIEELRQTVPSEAPEAEKKSKESSANEERA